VSLLFLQRSIPNELNLISSRDLPPFSQTEMPHQFLTNKLKSTFQNYKILHSRSPPKEWQFEIQNLIPLKNQFIQRRIFCLTRILSSINLWSHSSRTTCQWWTIRMANESDDFKSLTERSGWSTNKGTYSAWHPSQKDCFERCLGGEKCNTRSLKMNFSLHLKS